MNSKTILDVKINLGQYDEFVDKVVHLAQSSESSYICVANVHMLIEARRAASFAEVVNNADLVTPDGEPLTWALRFLYGIKQDRVAGMNLLPDLLSAAEKNHLPVAFYGGSEIMLEKAGKFLSQTYPNLEIVQMYSPPFRPLNQDEEQMHVDMINQSGARILFVVLGCPKQEKWMSSMKGRINASMIGIGGALPVLIGVQKRAPQWMQHAGLEWLYRLFQEPRRLFKRYATTNGMFVFLLLKEKLSGNRN